MRYVTALGSHYDPMAKSAKDPTLHSSCCQGRWQSLEPDLQIQMRTGVKWGFPGGSNSKEFSCNAGDLCSIPGSGRSPGGGHGNPLQYSCLENPMDRGTWWVAVHRVTELDMTEATKHAKGPGRWRDRPARLDTGKRS